MRVIATYLSNPHSGEQDNVYVLQLDLAGNERIESFIVNLRNKVNSVDIAIYLSAVLPGN